MPLTRTEGAEPAPSPDLELLAAHEPVVQFTEGELFLPAAVGDYVERCSLWADGPGGMTQLVPAGGLTLDGLAELSRRHRGTPSHLRFVQEPLTREGMREWRREERPQLRDKGRFATVGVIARLVDALLRLSLLVRGRVPGGLVAAAERMNRHLMTGGSTAGRHPYYGRVVRTGGYTVLQYWYFYAFNDWRSTFFGVNDHEADWETVSVYLAPGPDGTLQPAWVAASTHDNDGDNLRRRWDDPDLVRDGGHPVVFAGAGSHSHAFIAGDYVISVEIPALRRFVGAVQRLRRRVLPWTSEVGAGGFGIPFVDYARGDGPAVGPRRPLAWAPLLIDDDTPWVRDFRGLWGLDTRDPFGGERAPAGPRYERSGRVRTSWVDPLGWAGLDKVPATDAEREAVLRDRIDDLAGRLEVLDEEISTARIRLRGLHEQSRAARAHADIREWSRERRAELDRAQRDLAATIAQRSRLAEERDASQEFLISTPLPDPPGAHLRNPHLPHSIVRDRRLRFLRVWAAVSVPLLILGAGVLLARPTPALLTGFAVFLVVFTAVEAIARRRVLAFLTGFTVLAVLLIVLFALVVGLLRNWQVVLAGLLTLAALVLLMVNLREFRRR